jgi:hypothetical protein
LNIIILLLTRLRKRLLEVVRGREAAKEREKQFIKNLDPSWDLNDCGLRKKGERLDVGTFDLVSACSLVA